jgi:hypothetical protein
VTLDGPEVCIASKQVTCGGTIFDGADGAGLGVEGHRPAWRLDEKTAVGLREDGVGRLNAGVGSDKARQGGNNNDAGCDSQV